MATTEIGLWEDKFTLLSDESYLVLLSITLDELGKCGGIVPSYERV